MDKVFSTSAAWPDAPDGGGEMFVDLPATPCEMLDIREKLRLGERELALFHVDEFYRFDFLAPHLTETYALPELNALAEKLTELDERQTTALAGLVQMDEAKQSGPIGLPRLIDLAHSTECCHVVDEALNDAQLGRFCAENGFCPGLDDLPDEVFELLDFERIGREYRQSEGGVLVERTADHPGGYVQRHDEPQQVYKMLHLRPKKPAYTILAETYSGARVELPYPPHDPMGTEPVRCVDCAAPSLIGLTAGLESMDLLARRLAGMEPQDLTVYKALLEATDWQDLSDAGRLADTLDRYFFTPELVAPSQVARDELSTLLNDGAIALLLPHLDLERYGQALIRDCGGVLTCYGLIERADGHPIRMEEFQNEQREMEMSF